MGKHVVAALRDIPAGGRKRVEVEGRTIAIFNIGGELFGILDRCPHQGGPLCDGKLIGLLPLEHVVAELLGGVADEFKVARMRPGRARAEEPRRSSPRRLAAW